MSINDWEEYLFRAHSRAELATWVRSLHFFRYCRAVGGHANDGDRLLAAVAIQSLEELTETFSCLGLCIENLPKDNPQPVPGVEYTVEEFDKFVSASEAFGQIKQPGRVRLGDAEALVWIEADSLEISIVDQQDCYEVTAQAVDSARRVEQLLEPLADRVIDPPQDNQHCVCPKHYPELWAAT
jgi:hypothetical protein